MEAGARVGACRFRISFLGLEPLVILGQGLLTVRSGARAPGAPKGVPQMFRLPPGGGFLSAKFGLSL